MRNSMELRLVGCKLTHTATNYIFGTSTSRPMKLYRTLCLIDSTYTHYFRYVSLDLYNSGIVSLREYAAGTPNLIRNGTFRWNDSFVAMFQDAQPLDMIGTGGYLDAGSANNYRWNCNSEAGGTEGNLHFRQGRAITEQALSTDDFRFRPNSPLANGGVKVWDPYA